MFLLILIHSTSPVHAQSLALSSSQKEVKLQLFWHHQFAFAGFYAAIEQGYFKEKGLKVSFEEYDSNVDDIDNVVNEHITFGITGTNLLQSFHQGKDVKLMASYFKRSPLVIITQPEINSLTQLRNKTIYGQHKLLSRSGIREMLNLHNILPSSINTVNEGNAVQLFKEKKISAMIAWSSNEAFELTQKNIDFKIFNPSQFGFFTQNLNLFTSKSLAQKNPVLVNDFTEAANKGWQYAIEHPDEIIQLIKEKYNTQNKTIAALRYEANETIKLMSPDIYPIGLIQKDKLVHISESLLANKTINKVRDITELLLNNEVYIEGAISIELTNEELEYLKQHPVITAQNDMDYPPFNYIIDGKPLGYSIDLISMIAKILNVKVRLIQNKKWSEYVNLFKQKKLDVLLDIADIPQRHSYANFTSKIADLVTFAVIRKNNNINVATQQNTADMRIAIIKDYALNVSIKKSMPKATFIQVNNVDEALKALIAKEVDIYFDTGTVIEYYISRSFMPNLQLIPVAEELNITNQNFSIASHKDNPVLRDILQKALNAIPENEKIKLKRKWFGQNTKESGAKLKLTQEEKAYIAKNSPFTFCRQSDVSIGVSIFDLITRDIDINIKLSKLMPWSVALDALKNKKCDILTAASPTEIRRKTYKFTPYYARIKQAILTNKYEIIISDLSDHLNEKFAVIKGHHLIKSLKKEYPKIKLIEVNSTESATTLLDNGTAFGYIDAEWVLRKSFVNNEEHRFKINGQLRDKFDDIQSIATRKEDVVLNSILSKAVQASNKTEVMDVYTRAVGSNTKKIVFSDEEKWLLNLREITLCPADNIKAWDEVIAFITKTTQMNLVAAKIMSWNDTLNGLFSGKCDVLPQATETTERKKTMAFSPTIHQEERVLATLMKQPYIINIESYLDKTFILKKGDNVIEQLKAEYPTIKIQLANSSLDALQAIQNEQAFAFIDGLTQLGNTMNKYAMTNLKVAGSLPDRFNDKWAFATRKNDQVLTNIFSKILTTHINKIREIITNQSFTVKYEKGIDYTLFWQLLIVALVILSVIIFWNRRLALLNLQLQDAHRTIIIQEKMSSLGTLTAGVAHEINNPVNFTNAAVYMMKEEIVIIKGFLKDLAGGDKADEKVLQSFDDKFAKLIGLTNTATEGSNRIKTIVQDLRLFSRLDNEQQEKITLAGILKSTKHLVKTQYNEIEITLDVVADPLINGFPAKLSQVFMNIIVNACQAIESRQELNEQLIGNINISLYEKNSYAYIEFQDNGCGMDEETLQKVFDPFFTTKAVGSGTGLGMAISFGIIEEQGGLIDIISVINEGSLITIKLPI